MLIMYEERMFFFEKKNQKTFTSLGVRCGEVRDSEQKFFASFFQKRSSSSGVVR